MSFAAAIVIGLAVGNSTYAIIISATMTMLICWPIGLGCGIVIEKTLIDHIRQYKQLNPIPPDPADEPISEEEFMAYRQRQGLQEEQESEIYV